MFADMSGNYLLQEIIKNSFLVAPQTPGVYIYWNHKKRPIYVGKAKNLKNRLNSYMNVSLEAKTKKLMEDAKFFTTIQVGSELESLLLEARLVRKMNPKYNIQLKDDKHPLYIKITKDTYPIIKTARKMDKSQNCLAYFGPFPSSENVKFILKFIRKIVAFTDHLPSSKPCILNQIGLCNPCPSEIELANDPVVKKDLKYKFFTNLKIAKKILNGSTSEIYSHLVREMNSVAKQQNYEKALFYKNIIEKLDYIRQPVNRIDSFVENPNFLSEIRSKELNDLETLLSKYILLTGLRRIECFDIAHLMGQNPTASMVVFINGMQENSLYRKFKIRQLKGNSDVDSMKEVGVRRINHIEDWGRPDLIIVDGGKTQLNVFKSIFDKFNVPVVGLAKRFETLILKTNNDKYVEKRLSGNTLRLLQRIRNEAHRFARTYHHQLVNKTLLGSRK